MPKKLAKDAVFGKSETMAIGDRMRQLRGKEPRKAICEALGISLSALINYENNSRTPDAQLIGKLCERYNVTTDWLILGRASGGPELIDSTLTEYTNEHLNAFLNNKSSQAKTVDKKDWALDLSLADFESLWDEYRGERESRRGWLQVEVIKRFPEFLEWLEQRPAPLKPA